MTRRTLIPTSIHHSRCAGPRRGGVGVGAVGGSGCMRGQQKHRHAEGDREGAQKTHAVHENTTCGAFELNGLLTSSMGCLRAEGHVDSNPRKQRANRPAVVPRWRATAIWHSRTRVFVVHPRVAHTCATLHGFPTARSPTTRGASEPRFRLVDSGRSASHLVRNLVWARYPAGSISPS